MVVCLKGRMNCKIGVAREIKLCKEWRLKAMNSMDEKVLKILYLVPSDKMDLKEQRRREKIANQFLTNRRNKVFVRTTDGGPLSIESSIEESISVPYMLQKNLGGFTNQHCI